MRETLSDDVVGGASVLVHVITHLVNRTLCGAAAIGNLVAYVIDGALNPEAGLHNILIDSIRLGKRSVGSIANAIADSIKLTNHSLIIEPTLYIGRSRKIATIAIVTAIIVSEAIAPTAKEGEQDDEYPSSITVAPTVSIAVSRYGSDVGKTRSHRIKHDVFLSLREI